MKLKVFIERQNKHVDIDIARGTTIREVLARLNLNPVTVVTTVNKEVVTEEYKIQGTEKIEVHSVVSGG